ncbi:hypothetical protein O0880_09105 [Janthinobacterium sp. SUN118]|uniref:hypothetical protein n=1 Tax=Janthinobacterium sp. SUN118 TaxID=3004100 RepID=UPI0025AFE923|nr:hypothetical protein [Janthinobacterium sp. SUN118]MDN2709575.1 hypothetical protein [Janthinobacterium sp. SUN118]
MNNILRVRNTAGDLVVDSDTLGTECIGKASFSRIVQPYQEFSARQSGWSNYTFASDRTVLWAMGMPPGRRVGILGTSYLNGLHTVAVYCGANPDGDGFDVQEPVDIWAFSTLLDSKPSPFGLILRHSVTGRLTHDFGRPNVTFPIAGGDLDSLVQLPAVGRPVAIGNSPFRHVSYSPYDPDDPRSGYVKTDTRRFLIRYENNAVAYSSGTTHRSSNENGPMPEDTTFTEPSPFFIIDGTFLP